MYFSEVYDEIYQAIKLPNIFQNESDYWSLFTKMCTYSIMEANAIMAADILYMLPTMLL